MRRAVSTPVRVLLVSVYLAGLLAMIFGLFSVHVTVAGNDYSGALRSALICTMVSAACLLAVVLLGTARWRCVAVLTALPLVHIVAELVRRGGL